MIALLTRTVVTGGASAPLFHVQLILLQMYLCWVTFVVPVRSSYEVEAAAVAAAAAGGGAAGNKTIISQLVIPPQLSTFSGLLASGPGRASFRQHLQSEFSLENLFFVDDCEALRKWYADANCKLTTATAITTAAAGTSIAAAADSAADGTDELNPQRLELNLEARARAFDIYAKYIAAGATFELNLSGVNKRELHRVFRVTAKLQRAGLRNKYRAGASGENSHQPSTDGGIKPHPHRQHQQHQQHQTGSVGINLMDEKQPLATTTAKHERSADDAPPRPPTIAFAAAGTVSSRTPSSQSKAPPPATPTVVGGIPPTGVVTPALSLPATAQAKTGAHRHPSDSARGGGGGSGIGAGPGGLPVIEDAPRDASYYVHLYDASHAEIWHLLISDSYVRYVNSSLFERLVKQQTMANELAAQSIAAPTDNARNDSIALTVTAAGAGAGVGGSGAGPIDSSALGTVSGALGRTLSPRANGASHVGVVQRSKTVSPASPQPTIILLPPNAVPE